VKAVANSSVLIALSSVGNLDLLARKFPDGVLVPGAVWSEVVDSGEGRPGAQEVAAAPWIRVESVLASSVLALLEAELDSGEAEAIALALQLGLRQVLLDEKEARERAR